MTKSMVRQRNILMTIKQYDKKNVTIMKSIYNAIINTDFLKKQVDYKCKNS